MGTYHYYSPEMWDKKYDEFGNIKAIRGEVSDLWALGITFYRLATGRFPYEEA
jgi:serine/threonine protein kinase